MISILIYFLYLRTIDNVIGRTAHIKFLDSDPLTKMFVNCFDHLFAWKFFLIKNICIEKKLNFFLLKFLYKNNENNLFKNWIWCKNQWVHKYLQH